MKISHPIAIKLVSLLGSWVLRLWLKTQDYWFCMDDPDSDPNWTDKRNIYLFWHEMMLFPLATHCGPEFAMLVSRHRDGELISQVMRMFQGRTVRGSTSRGAVAGLLGMMRGQAARHLGITPDGPRGPRRVVQEGAIYLASRTGMPLVPVGFAFGDCWRVGSWDRMALPRPFRLAVSIAARPVSVPAEIDREGIQTVRREIQQAMDGVQQRAEDLAECGKIVAGMEPASRALDPSTRAERWGENR